MITAEIKGKKLVLTIDMEAQPVLSASGKTFVVASSRGNVTTTATVNGQPVVVGVNAYIKRTNGAAVAPAPEQEEAPAGRFASK